MGSLLLFVFIGGFIVWPVVRCARHVRASQHTAHADTTSPAATATVPHGRIWVAEDGMPTEAAFGFPGMPPGMSVTQYAAGGLDALRIHLIQSSRTPPSDG